MAHITTLPNLVAYYPFNGDGREVVNSLDATITGDSNFTGIGKFNQAYEGDGTDGYATVPDNDIFSHHNGTNDLPFSISYWVYQNNTGPLIAHVDKSSSSATMEWRAQTWYTAIEFLILTDNTNFLRARADAFNVYQAWRYITITYDGSETAAGIKLYIDGAITSSVNTETGTYTGSTNRAAPVNFGTLGATPTSYELEGKLQNVAFWDKELTASEVTEIYTTENNGEYLFDDAHRFIAAVGTLTASEETAIINLVDGLKANGTWDKYDAIYPFIGGTAAEHKWNLKDPQDTDAAFRITWDGTITHDANGVKSDGSTGYGNTHFNPTTEASSNTDFSLAVYKKGLEVSGSSKTYLGEYSNANNQFTLLGWIATGSKEGGSIAGATSGDYVPASQSQQEGFLAVTVNGNRDAQYYKDGISVGATNTQAGGFGNRDIWFMRSNWGDGTSGSFATESVFSFTSIGKGLSATDMANDYAVIEAYQLELGRSVDAQRFIDAVGTLTASEETAIHNLVAGLKANGTWTKYHAIYPFIGGTAAEHKWNLKDPQDTDAAYRLQYTGTITHDANGMTGDGSTGYADTHYINPAAQDFHMQAYVNSNNTNVNDDAIEMGIYELGPYDGGAAGVLLGVKRRNTDTHLNMMNGEGGQAGRWFYGDDGQAKKHLIGTRLGTTYSIYKDGALLTSRTETTTHDGILDNFPIYLLGNSNSGTAPNPDPYVGGLSNQTLAFVAIGDALTATEAADDYATIEAYQVELARSNNPGGALALETSINTSSTVTADTLITSQLAASEATGSTVTAAAGQTSQAATSLSGTSTISADAQTVTKISATISGSSTQAAGLSSEVSAAADVQTSTTTAASTIIESTLQASTSAGSTTTASPGFIDSIATTIAGGSTTSAEGNIITQAAANIAGTSTLVGALGFAGAGQLEANISTTTTTTADAGTTKALQASAAGTTTITANAELGDTLQAAISGSSTLAAQAIIAYTLSAALTPGSTLAANLTIVGVIDPLPDPLLIQTGRIIETYLTGRIRDDEQTGTLK